MEGGFLTPTKGNATRLVVVVGLHGAALTAVALSRMEMPVPKVFPPIFVDNYSEPLPPPEVVPESKPSTPKAAAPSKLAAEDPIIDLPRHSSVEGEAGPLPLPPLGTSPGPEIRPGSGGTELVKALAPVRVEASVDPRYAANLQPPYPPSEQRMGSEGKVTVRVTIGTDGRVKAVARVSATSDAFFRATERQALSRWRFRPATEDGRPVESQKVMSVTFRMES